MWWTKKKKYDENGKLIRKKSSPRQLLEKKLDKAVLDIIRKNSHHTCYRCKRVITDLRVSTPSHFINRGRKTVKWNLTNVNNMCLYCHQLVEKRKNEYVVDKYYPEGWNYTEEKKKELGQRKFDELVILGGKTADFSLGDLEDLLEKYTGKKSKTKQINTLSKEYQTRH